MKKEDLSGVLLACGLGLWMRSSTAMEARPKEGVAKPTSQVFNPRKYAALDKMGFKFAKCPKDYSASFQIRQFLHDGIGQGFPVKKENLALDALDIMVFASGEGKLCTASMKSFQSSSPGRGLAKFITQSSFLVDT